MAAAIEDKILTRAREMLEAKFDGSENSIVDMKYTPASGDGQAGYFTIQVAGPEANKFFQNPSDYNTSLGKDTYKVSALTMESMRYRRGNVEPKSQTAVIDHEQRIAEILRLMREAVPMEAGSIVGMRHTPAADGMAGYYTVIGGPGHRGKDGAMPASYLMKQVFILGDVDPSTRIDNVGDHIEMRINDYEVDTLMRREAMKAESAARRS